MWHTAHQGLLEQQWGCPLTLAICWNLGRHRLRLGGPSPGRCLQSAAARSPGPKAALGGDMLGYRGPVPGPSTAYLPFQGGGCRLSTVGALLPLPAGPLGVRDPAWGPPCSGPEPPGPLALFLKPLVSLLGEEVDSTAPPPPRVQNLLNRKSCSPLGSPVHWASYAPFPRGFWDGAPAPHHTRLGRGTLAI